MQSDCLWIPVQGTHKQGHRKVMSGTKKERERERMGARENEGEKYQNYDIQSI